MRCDTLTPTIPLRSNWPTQLWAGLASGWRRCWQLWQAHECHLREQREIALVAELDPRMLRDIGAPDDVQAAVMERQQAGGDCRDRLLRSGAWRHW